MKSRIVGNKSLSPQLLYEEAKLVRNLLEKYKNHYLNFLPSNFPHGSCQSSSLLLSYHLFDKYNLESITGVSALLKNDDNRLFSHFWLEVNNHSVDITMDQFNIYQDIIIIKKPSRFYPFKKVYTGYIGSIPQYKIFKINNRIQYHSDFNNITPLFIDQIKETYQKIIN